MSPRKDYLVVFDLLLLKLCSASCTNWSLLLLNQLLGLVDSCGGVFGAINWQKTSQVDSLDWIVKIVYFLPARSSLNKSLPASPLHLHHSICGLLVVLQVAIRRILLAQIERIQSHCPNRLLVIIVISLFASIVGHIWRFLSTFTTVKSADTFRVCVILLFGIWFAISTDWLVGGKNWSKIVIIVRLQRQVCWRISRLIVTILIPLQIILILCCHQKRICFVLSCCLE